MVKQTKQKNTKGENTVGGYALYTAIILTGALILISYATANVSIKELSISGSNADSHMAFYNADTGLECALYADVKAASSSEFAINAPGTVNCNGQTITTGSQTVATNPTQPSFIGGGGAGNPTSVFEVDLSAGCAIVFVTKNPDGTTAIQSHGYNSCSGSHRLERGIEITY